MLVWAQVVFAGGRLQPGTTKLEEDCEHQPFSVLATDGSRDSVIKHIQLIQKVIRRRPFMIKALEPVLKRSVQCLVSAVYACPVPVTCGLYILLG